MKYVKKTGFYSQSTTGRSRSGWTSPHLATLAHSGDGKYSPGALLCKFATLFLTLGLIGFLSACKIRIEVPKGGSVVSASGLYSCSAGESCEIDVVDQFFSDKFKARPAPGYVFKHWLDGSGTLCGNTAGACTLATTQFNDNPRLVSILESDSVFRLIPVFVEAPRLNKKDLVAAGDVVAIADGFEIRGGSLAMKLGKNIERTFTDADLQLKFNARGELLSLAGEGNLPTELTEHVALPADVRAEIGLYTGAEINADDAFEITLKDERQYLVFLLDAGVDYKVSNRDNPEDFQSITVGTPAAGKIVMILDPADDMLYRYGETPLVGAAGEAESDKGLLPYKPVIDNQRLDSFDGHYYQTVSVGVGIKAVDFLNLTGSQVTRDPQFTDVDLSDPFNSDVSYRAGFNGSADFSFSIVGFDIFSFELAKASATFQVGSKRQAMTLAGDLEPDVSWVPDWVRIVPSSRIALDITADSDGILVANFSGSYRSTLPRADIAGNFRLAPEAVTLTGRVIDAMEIPVTMTLADEEVHATVGIKGDYSAEIEAGMGAAFDRAEAEVEQAVGDLEQALQDLEFEVSLRGLRSSLPAIADRAVSELNAIPGIVGSAVRSRAKHEIDKRNKCVLGKCLISSSKRNSIAGKAADYAEGRARDDIRPYRDALLELKKRALEADDEHLRGALERALREAYRYRRFSKTYSYTVKVAGVFSRKISYTYSRTILSDDIAGQVLMAADNMHRIPATAAWVVRGREVVERLPTREILDEVRAELEAGVRTVPGIESVGYSVIRGEYAAFVALSDGSRHEVGFNVLDPVAGVAGIADLLTRSLLDQ